MDVVSTAQFTLEEVLRELIKLRENSNGFEDFNHFTGLIDLVGSTLRRFVENQEILNFQTYLT